MFVNDTRLFQSACIKLNTSTSSYQFKETYCRKPIYTNILSTKTYIFFLAPFLPPFVSLLFLPCAMIKFRLKRKRKCHIRKIIDTDWFIFLCKKPVLIHWKICIQSKFVLVGNLVKMKFRKIEVTSSTCRQEG